MAGNKIFYVTRTEDETTQTAGAATKTRADKPQLLKIVGVDHAGNPSPATPEDNQIYATEEEKQEILLTSDTVQAGDLNPVTSDAVATYIANQLELSDYEDFSITTTNQVAQFDGIACICLYGSGYRDTEFYVNDVLALKMYFTDTDVSMSDGQTLILKKGDTYRYSGAGPNINKSKVRWYKLRDYSKRT